MKKNVEQIEVPQIGFTSTVRIIEDFDHVKFDSYKKKILLINFSIEYHGYSGFWGK